MLSCQMLGLKLKVDFPPCSYKVLCQPEFQFPGIFVCLQLNLVFSAPVFFSRCSVCVFLGGGG